MRVLVTGGAGYIGSATAAALLAEGHEVVVVDDLRRGHRDLVPPEATFIDADVAHPESFLSRAGPVGACPHFAAAIEAGESMQVPEAFFTAKTATTLHLLQGLVEAGVDRFVLSSTAAVDGGPGSAACAAPPCATSTPRARRPNAARTTTRRRTSSPSCCRSQPGGGNPSASTGRTTRPATARACATTSTSVTSPRPTSSV